MPPCRVDIMGTLAAASGTAGMAGGQALDLAAEGGSLTLADLEQLHALKTGALIRASVLMAARCAALLTPSQLQSLTTFGDRVGLAFQVQDDILDIEGDVAVIGKPPGSDQARGMPTYPAPGGAGGGPGPGADAARRSQCRAGGPRLGCEPPGSPGGLDADPQPVAAGYRAASV